MTNWKESGNSAGGDVSLRVRGVREDCCSPGRTRHVAVAVGICRPGCILGFARRKSGTWLHREPLRGIVNSGACIQVFLLVSFGVLAVGGGAAEIGIGTVLDASTPRVFLGMAIGRPGCYFT